MAKLQDGVLNCGTGLIEGQNMSYLLPETHLSVRTLKNNLKLLIRKLSNWLDSLESMVSKLSGSLEYLYKKAAKEVLEFKKFKEGSW